MFLVQNGPIISPITRWDFKAAPAQVSPIHALSPQHPQNQLFLEMESQERAAECGGPVISRPLLIIVEVRVEALGDALPLMVVESFKEEC